MDHQSNSSRYGATPDVYCMRRAFWIPVVLISLVWTTGLAFSQDEVEKAASPPSQLKSQYDESVRPVLEKYCFRCHGPEKKKSGVRVDILDGSLEDEQLFLLKHVLKQLKEGSMPPKKARQPSVEERKVVLEWVSQVLRAGERKVRARNGSVRRLTVEQYHNTLRDLLGVEDLLAKSLPADGVSKEGFRNNQSTLLMMPQMMETYFEIAEKALDLCLVDETKKPRIQCFRVELGKGLNKNPTEDNLVLNGPSLLPKANFLVRQVAPDKPFPFEPLAMRTKFRFIEGYAGNNTVRAWKDFEGIYHNVFASMNGKFTGGLNYGRSHLFVSEGLLLRPRSPETQNGNPPGQGPFPTFSIPLRELPRSGLFQLTVEAARYDDGYQPSSYQRETGIGFELNVNGGKGTSLEIPEVGIYQLDIGLEGQPLDDVMTADIGQRTFSRRLKGKFAKGPGGEVIIPFLVARFVKGASPIKIGNGDGKNLRRVHVTPVSADSEAGRRFAAFEKRVPTVSAHIGVRTDVGPRSTRLDQLKAVPSSTVERYSFRAPISSFPSPETEEGNANYLAGLWEIAIRSEPSGERQVPRLLLSAVEFEGPFYETWPPRGHREIFIPSKLKGDSPAYAREVLERFATRAFRRPVTAKELSSLVGVWRESYASKKDFQQSIKNALLVALTSPQFLFIVEESAGPQAEPLSPHELAAKLSYFLWNTAPDEKLLEFAGSGKLGAVVSSEVDRLVADDRFQQFADEFASRWLSLDKFDVVSINHGAFPRLNRETRRELRKEPIQFVAHLIRGNLPLRNLIDSDFIMANEVVESYYGIDGGDSQGFEFVPVRHKSKSLGGVLTQAAILSGLSDGHESNPVKRGAWLARKIIAEPPEPPPPNVPDLGKETKGKTLRERLEQHRSQEGCAQCHQKIDPWGLPFEEFDAAGLFKKKKVDARSTLPDSTEVAGSNELKKYLSTDRIDQVAYSFLKHLASYAIGRSLTFNELEYLKNKGEKALGAAGYRMKDCVRFVIQSPMFMEK
jgi:mono/diheme cytochrome c family protein